MDVVLHTSDGRHLTKSIRDMRAFPGGVEWNEKVGDKVTRRTFMHQLGAETDSISGHYAEVMLEPVEILPDGSIREIQEANK